MSNHLVAGLLLAGILTGIAVAATAGGLTLLWLEDRILPHYGDRAE